MKKFLKLCLKISLSLLLTMALFEVGLRLFPGVIPIELLYRFNEEPRAEIARRFNLPTEGDTVIVERDDGGPELRVFKPLTEIHYDFDDPGTVKTVVMDDFGFCNPPEATYDRLTIDIITIGDSFTWCTTVAPQETWTTKLSNKLDQAAYNLGMSGIGLYEYLQILKTYGLQKSPKIVIMNVYEGNDLRDALKFQSRRNLGVSIQNPQTTYYKFFYNPFERYSYAVNFVTAAISGLQALGYLDPPPPPPNFRYHLVTAEQPIPYNGRNVDTDEVVYAEQLVRGTVDVAVFTEALETFVALAQAHDFTPVVVYTPSAYTAYAAQVNFEEPTLNDLMPQFSQSQRRFFENKAAELGYIFIDTTPAFQAAAPNHTAPDNLLYYQTNLHLTSQGHTIVAEAVSRVLKERGVSAR